MSIFIKHCHLLVYPFRRMACTAHFTSVVIITVFAVSSDNNWIKPTTDSVSASLFSVHTFPLSRGSILSFFSFYRNFDYFQQPYLEKKLLRKRFLAPNETAYNLFREVHPAFEGSQWFSLRIVCCILYFSYYRPLPGLSKVHQPSGAPPYF